MNQKELREWIECYRPGQDDNDSHDAAQFRAALESDPALREHFGRVQAWDKSLGQAIRDVPVPEGLCQRLLDAVAAEPNSEPAAVAVASPSGNRRTLRWERWERWPLRTAVAIGTAIALLLVLQWAFWNDSLTGAQVAHLAKGWIQTLDQDGWRREQPPLERYPVPNSLDFPLEAWQNAAVMGDDHAVVYRAVQPQARSLALLFVVQTRQGRQLPGRPQLVPDSTTGNVCVGVWKQKNHLFVLAVQGTPQTYRRLLRTQEIALLSTPSQLGL